MKNTAAKATMMNTMMVVTVVSFLLGQVTFLTSPITSRTYWAGFIVAIGLSCLLLRLNRAEARSLIPARFVVTVPQHPPGRLSCCPAAGTPAAYAGRSGGARTPNPRFWRPVLYQLSYPP